jgi:dipeptidase E
MKLLLFSNSTNAGEAYFSFPLPYIKEHLKQKVSNGLFIPFAGVSISYDEYANTVKEKFNSIDISLNSIHTLENKANAIKNSDLIVIGGGNTFHLLYWLKQFNLIPLIKEKVMNGTPFIGWSAGSNVACPSIKTTNDMPIIEPESFSAAGLVPFQINPHYLDANPDGHAGETREMRIEEFLLVNKTIPVVGLREGTALYVNDGKMDLLGKRPARVFMHGKEPMELNPGEDFSFLL